MDNDDNDATANEDQAWHLDAEEDYLRGRVGSLRALAQKYDVAPGTMFGIAKRRKWSTRRKTIEAEAARKIDALAEIELVDAWQSTTRNLMSAGQRASAILNHTLGLEGQRLAEAQQRGESYSPQVGARVLLDVIRTVDALKPRMDSGASGPVMDVDELLERLRMEPPSEDHTGLEDLCLPAANDNGGDNGNN